MRLSYLVCFTTKPLFDKAVTWCTSNCLQLRYSVRPNAMEIRFSDKADAERMMREMP